MSFTTIAKGSEGAGEKSIAQQSENFSAHAARDTNLADPANSKLAASPEHGASAQNCLKEHFGCPAISDGGKDLVAQAAPEAAPQSTATQEVKVPTTIGNDTLRAVPAESASSSSAGQTADNTSAGAGQGDSSTQPQGAVAELASLAAIWNGCDSSGGGSSGGSSGSGDSSGGDAPASTANQSATGDSSYSPGNYPWNPNLTTNAANAA